MLLDLEPSSCRKVGSEAALKLFTCRRSKSCSSFEPWEVGDGATIAEKDMFALDARVLPVAFCRATAFSTIPLPTAPLGTLILSIVFTLTPRAVTLDISADALSSTGITSLPCQVRLLELPRNADVEATPPTRVFRKFEIIAALVFCLPCPPEPPSPDLGPIALCLSELEFFRSRLVSLESAPVATTTIEGPLPFPTEPLALFVRS
jgi:hypothetical protein